MSVINILLNNFDLALSSLSLSLSLTLFRGAGQEVGRSCIMLEFKNKKIMVSYGEHKKESIIFALATKCH